MSRSRAAMRTWVASLAFTAATMLTGFVVTPFVLGILGSYRYGIARTLTEVFAYLNIIAIGITISLVPRMAAAAGRGDRAMLDRCLAVGVRLYLGAAAVVIIVGLAMTPFLGMFLRVPLELSMTPFLGMFLEVPTEARRELNIAWLICLCGVPLTTLALMKVLMDIAHKGYITNLLMAAQGVITAFLTIYLVWAGWGVPGMMLAILVMSILYNLLVTGMAMRNYPHLLTSILTARPQSEDWKGVLTIIGPTVLAILSERVGVLSDSILLAAMLGPAAATVLFVTQRLANLGQMVLNAISNSVWPSLAEMYARGEIAAFNIRLIELTRLVGLMGVTGLAPVIAYNRHFLTRWLGAGYDGGGRDIVIVASCNAVLLTLVSIYNVALVSTGKVARLAKSAALSAVLNVVASVLFTKWLGIIGPVLGTLVATLAVQAWYVPLQLRRVFETPLRGLLRAIAAPMLWAIPYTMLLCVISDSHTPRGWFGLLGEMAVAAIVFLILGIALILGPHDRQLWNARLVAPLLARVRRGSN